MKKVSPYIRTLLLPCVTILLYLVASYLYFNKAVSFSFVDEFDHIVVAHFMLQGNELFTDIFHNRQFGPAYISYLIQSVLQPDSLYSLILYHRLAIIGFSVVAGLSLVVRFGWAAFFFLGLFEPFKFYLHGNLFIGESFAVYPLVYLFGLVLNTTKGSTVSRGELYFISILTFFVCLMREPYVPLALFMWASLTYSKGLNRTAIQNSILLVAIAVGTLAILPLSEYFSQLVTVNSLTVAASEMNKFSHPFFAMLASFLYPVTIIFAPYLTHFAITQKLIALAFLAYLTYIFCVPGQKRVTILLFVIFALAAIRPTTPGGAFYNAYKALIWHGMALFFISFQTLQIYRTYPKIRTHLVLAGSALILYTIAGPGSHVLEKVNTIETFDVQYNSYSTYGNIINTLKSDDDTLFIDGYGSLTYVVANVPPAYQKILFYPILRSVSEYVTTRENMFTTNPPSLYIFDCIAEKIKPLPVQVRDDYSFFHYKGSETCLAISRTKLASTHEELLLKIRDVYGYELH